MATDTEVINAVFGLGTSDIPLLPTALEQWYAANIEPDVLIQLNAAPAANRAQFQNDVWQAFRAEQFGKSANQLNAEKTTLRTRYAGLARSKAATVSTPATPPERLPASPDEASAQEIYTRIYNSFRQTNEPAARAAASAGKAAFLAARARGEDLATAVQSAQTVALQTWRMQTGQGGGVNVPPPTPAPPVNGGGGTGGLPALPPLDLGGGGGGGGGLPALPPLDMGGGGTGGLPALPPASTSGRVKFDADTMFASYLDVPEFIAMIPWGEVLGWLMGNTGDPSAESFLSALLNRLLGRKPTEVNHANCALMGQMFVEDFPEAAKAVAYFQCGVTHPIGLNSKEAQAVWHALHLVTSGYVIQSSNGSCSCSPRGGGGNGNIGIPGFDLIRIAR